ncbi:MAG: hypothetical protein V1828_00220 [Candidatus Omnitrophota bacterium]
MRNLILAVCALAVFSFVFPATGVCGERMKKDTAKQAQFSTPSGATAQEKKQALINNFNIMRNQELRVILLQQMLNEELIKLNNLQEQFCKLYNLDINKLRQGLYRYDDAQEKFIEVQPQAQPQLPTQQQ